MVLPYYSKQEGQAPPYRLLRIVSGSVALAVHSTVCTAAAAAALACLFILYYRANCQCDYRRENEDNDYCSYVCA